MVAQNDVMHVMHEQQHEMHEQPKFIVTYGGNQVQDDHETIPVVHESFGDAYEFMVLMCHHQMHNIDLSAVSADDCFENHKIRKPQDSPGRLHQPPRVVVWQTAHRKLSSLFELDYLGRGRVKKR
jgi:hypothetical protein